MRLPVIRCCCIALCIAISLFVVDHIQAEQRAPAIATLKHTQPKAIPPPGTPITFEVELVNSPEARRPLRMYAVRDGRAIETTIPEATYNIKERPTYSFEITAPIVEIRYQFFLGEPPAPTDDKTQRNETIIESQVYSLQRPCVPASALHNVTTSETAAKEIIDASQDLKSIIVKSRQIEEEGAALEQARVQLEQILKITAISTNARAKETKHEN